MFTFAPRLTRCSPTQRPRLDFTENPQQSPIVNVHGNVQSGARALLGEGCCRAQLFSSGLNTMMDTSRRVDAAPYRSRPRPAPACSTRGSTSYKYFILPTVVRGRTCATVGRPASRRLSCLDMSRPRQRGQLWPSFVWPAAAASMFEDPLCCIGSSPP